MSTKLNYHEHWKAIIEDVEQEYRMLSLDYMRRTFHGFSPETSGDTPEIIWWSVFANEQKNFIKACKTSLTAQDIGYTEKRLTNVPIS